ncbi:MAG: hypothetical protein WC692_09790 [Erythrobacter sp.]
MMALFGLAAAAILRRRRKDASPRAAARDQPAASFLST